MNPTLTQLTALAHLSERREYADLLEWLAVESEALTRKGLSTADPHTCGAATLLQDLRGVLENAQSLHKQAMKTLIGSSSIL